ncbi:hypothetical protein ACQKIE_12585 [Luteibacter sp. NPDC031894]|jgi:hypothetical protein|uniref:hypothetical protein n=1 Tax=Luteibacter sp. NPDC031894 TaxID=3390572 RepID=UPI003CFE34B1
MPMFRTHAALVALALLAAPCVAGAQSASRGESPPASFGAPTPADQLQGMTGGADTHVTNNLNTQESNGTVSENKANGTYSGSNFVGDSAFSNSAGLPTVIQNSGNNVLIQNNTIVNLRMNP